MEHTCICLKQFRVKLKTFSVPHDIMPVTNNNVMASRKIEKKNKAFSVIANLLICYNQNKPTGDGPA